VDARLWTRLGSRYRSGRSKDWLKLKNPNAPAVKREGEGDWGREPVAVKKAKKTHKTGGVIVRIVIVLLTYLARRGGVAATMKRGLATRQSGKCRTLGGGRKTAAVRIEDPRQQKKLGVDLRPFNNADRVWRAMKRRLTAMMPRLNSIKGGLPCNVCRPIAATS
jgi:hypothetical protein